MFRSFALFLSALALGCASGPAYTPPKVERTIWVSGKTGTIERFVMFPDGRLDFIDEVNVGANPSFMSSDPLRRILYVADEEAGTIVTLRFDAKGGVTTLAPPVEAGGGPTHIVARDGRVMVANYVQGTVVVYAIAANGTVKPQALQTLTPGKNAHQVAIDPTGRFVYVPCLGSDHIAQYVIDKTGLRENGIVKTAAKAGPRHLAFHPARPLAFGLNELDSTLQVYAIANDGRLSPVGAPVSMLPEGFKGTNSAAELQVSRDARYLYASNRGHDSIVQLEIDPTSGALTPLRFTPVAGEKPRHFIIDASGKWLIAAHEKSDTVAVFTIDQRDGKLTQVAGKHVGEGPQFVDFVP